MSDDTMGRTAIAISICDLVDELAMLQTINSHQQDIVDATTRYLVGFLERFDKAASMEHDWRRINWDSLLRVEHCSRCEATRFTDDFSSAPPFYVLVDKGGRIYESNDPNPPCTRREKVNA